MLQSFRELTHVQRRAFIACFLGWTLDAFDFFILTFCLDSVAQSFHVGIPTIAYSLTWTLCMRPVGALLFGVLAERFGRKPTLMLNIVCFSVFEVASAFAPTFHVFLVMRALFGIAMGGEWGVGAALALETLPAKNRGFFSGLLQEGYVVGNLLAAAVYGLVFPHLHGVGYLENWRVLFLIGAAPALLVFYVRHGVEESPAWEAARASNEGQAPKMPLSKVFQQIGANLPMFLFLTLMMTAFTSFSHGTQDLYPTFLKKDHHLTAQATSVVAIIGSLGALCGGILCGTLSEKFGRRKTIVWAALLALPMIPLWDYSHTAVMLAAGGFFMQFMVQGAWGVIPVHLNELAPPPVRALFPGLAYQLGNLLSSQNGHFQAALAQRYFDGHLEPVLAWTVVIVGVTVALCAGFGKEAKGADLSGVEAV
jgi:SHS family lactate transporter-like MFS transporter